MLEKYLTYRRRWSGRIKKSGYDCRAAALSYFFTVNVSLVHETDFYSSYFAHQITGHLLSCCGTWGSAQALERQKEYTDAIRIERDELREEVVKLKDILKVLGPYVGAADGRLWTVL